MSITPSGASFSNNSKTIIKTMPKPLLLRDYLLDDMSSCSSNGFRSYPRRQCCTTVRFLMEMDLNINPKLPPKQIKTTWKSKPKRKQYSMLQRASSVMFDAFKHFSIKSTNIMSRKLLKHGLWKKTDHHNNEIKRLISFGDLLKETEFTKPTSTAEVITSSTSNVSSISNSNSWSNNGLTATTNSFTTNKSFEVNLTENVDLPKRNEKTRNVKRVGVTNTTATTTNSCDTSEDTKEWQNDQDEQFSPVSVMDFPSDNDASIDDEEEVSSSFQNRHLNTEGTKQLMHKTRRFKSVPQLEPVKLEDRIAKSVIESSSQTCLDFAQQENQDEKKAMALLQLMKSTISSHYFIKHEAVDSLLLGFFKEKMTEENVFDYEMLHVAKDWMDGQMEEMFLDWDSQEDRKTYIKEMEKGFRWSKHDDKSEKEHIVMELEFEIFNSLVDEVLLDL